MEVVGDFDTCDRQAEELLIDNAMRIMSSSDYKAGEILAAGRDCRSIQRGRSISAKAGVGRLARFTARLRISRWPKQDYRELLMHISLARAGKSQIPSRSRGMAGADRALYHIRCDRLRGLAADST